MSKPKGKTLYDYFNENQHNYKVLIKAGYCSVNIVRDLNIYHFFECTLKETGSRMTAAANSAETYKLSERTIFLIIKRLSKRISNE